MRKFVHRARELRALDCIFSAGCTKRERRLLLMRYL